MSQGARLRRWYRRTGSEFLGWTLVVIGIPMMPLPGPGTIVLVAGIALLAPHYAWARRILDPLRVRAIAAAKYGVATLPRIVVSALGGLWLFALGVVWWISPNIPRFEVLGFGFGPELPAHGWGTGVGLMASAVAAWSLLAYSVHRWRPENEPTFGSGAGPGTS
ncbi:PGPGW domain-containing protein [Aeromicrobium sp.]|uniref:PGPGW domain-containing protein n=1 Tax=Aeromicrobium sp. TaxID=1871063 RepID=UPI003D6A08A4